MRVCLCLCLCVCARVRLFVTITKFLNTRTLIMAHPEWRTPVLAASSARQSLSVLSGNLCWNLSATPRAEASCRRSTGAGTGALDERVVATVLACAGSIPSHSEKICRSRTRLKMQGRSGNAIVVAMRRVGHVAFRKSRVTRHKSQAWKCNSERGGGFKGRIKGNLASCAHTHRDTHTRHRFPFAPIAFHPSTLPKKK